MQLLSSYKDVKQKLKKINCDSFTEKYLELAKLFIDDKLSEEIYPLCYKHIQKEQVGDTKLVDYAEKQTATPYRIFMGEKSHTN